MKQFDIRELDFQEIEVFLKVAENNSITKTSEILHISPSAVSKNLTRFEQCVGLILFIRNNNRLQLTPAGKVLHERLSLVVENTEKAIMEAHKKQEAYANTLRIGIPSHFSIRRSIQPYLTAHRMQYPDFDYNYKTYELYELVDALLNENVECIITFQELINVKAHPEIEYRILFETQNVAVMRDDHPLSGMQRLTAEDLKTCSLCMFSPNLKPDYFGNMILPIYLPHNTLPEIRYCANSAEEVIANLTGHDVFVASDLV